MTVQNKKLSSKERMERLRKGAKEELVVAETIQFRADREMMLLLMQVADKKKLPLGTLVRTWTADRLAAEGYKL